MRRPVLLAALMLLSALSLSAQEAQLSISPALGPSSGGTIVTIKTTGSFGGWPYSVVFGDVSAAATVVDDQTMVAVAPEHLPGIVDIRLFQYDIYLSTDLTFEFVGHPDREQFLVPVFLDPVKGAYGSEFRTELHGLNAGRNQLLKVWGLQPVCRTTPPICGDWLTEPMVSLEPGVFGTDLADYQLYQTGTPGRFIEVPRAQKDDLSLSLRVSDTSRSAENFGTEIPVVRTADFFRTGFALLGVPLDPRFRNTLRLYATGPTTVHLLVGNDIHEVALRAGAHAFDPAYAQFTAFPAGSGTIRVLAAGKENGPAVWGFITVTNNETQHITTIAPR